jgi:outer membrane protein TolC
LKELYLSEGISKANFDYGQNKLDWTLDLGAGFKDSRLQTLSSLDPEKTLTHTKSIELKKSTYNYGTFSISHEQLGYDLSNWGESSLTSLGDNSFLESKNSFSYSYDFLNRSMSKDWDILNAQNRLEKLQNSIAIQKDHFDFFTAYSGAKLRVMLDRLYKEFELKAKRRVKLIKKRVKDGLSRKYELNKAKLSLLSQQETLLRNTSALREKVAIIENIVKMEIHEKDYHFVNWTFKPAKDFPYIFNELGSMDLNRLKELNSIASLGVAKIEDEAGYSLKLNLKYSKSSINSKHYEAIDDSFGNGMNDEKIAALIYSIPLGPSKKEALKNKLRAQEKKNTLSLVNLQGELEIQGKVLKENIKRYNQGVNLLASKIKVAESSLKEHQKLYLRGQVSFEELIRAEETLITAKISKMNMYSLYEQSISQLALLSGNIIKFLNNYTD